MQGSQATCVENDWEEGRLAKKTSTGLSKAAHGDSPKLFFGGITLGTLARMLGIHPESAGRSEKAAPQLGGKKAGS